MDRVWARSRQWVFDAKCRERLWHCPMTTSRHATIGIVPTVSTSHSNAFAPTSERDSATNCDKTGSGTNVPKIDKQREKNIAQKGKREGEKKPEKSNSPKQSVLKIVYISGAGLSCFYRACALGQRPNLIPKYIEKKTEAIDIIEKETVRLRNEVADYMALEDNRRLLEETHAYETEYFQGSLDQRLEQQRGYGSAADGLEVAFFCNMTNCRVKIYSKDSKIKDQLKLITDIKSESEKCIQLLYSSNEFGPIGHYDLLVET